MGARRLAGLAILAAVAPLTVLLASSPAHADPNDDPQPYEEMRLPPGYPAGSCRPSANPPPSPNAVSSVDCLNNTLPGGPPFARYEVFADQTALNNAFQTDVRSTTLQPCPGSSDSAPATWNATNPPPANGSVICYTTNDNMAHVEWTNTSDVLRANASGPDMASLYGWWHGLITTA